LCELLDGAELFFVGDSFVRHVHSAMLMALNDNYETGAFSSNIKPGKYRPVALDRHLKD
jgi:hypothetical protein